MKPELTVVIPCAGKTNTPLPKCLIKLGNGDTVLSRQIKLIHRALPHAEIIVVVGYKFFKIIHTLSSTVNYINNEDYENNGAAFSIQLGIKAANSKKILVICGDLVFEEKLLNNLVLDKSKIWINQTEFKKDNAVGITSSQTKSIHLSYGLKQKWAQLLFLEEPALSIFQRESILPRKRRYCTFEILNEVIKYHPLGCDIISDKIIEVDNTMDIKKANKIIYDEKLSNI